MTSNILFEGNHELMKLIRKRIDQKPLVSMLQIAAELGVDCDEMCAWIMRYKEPRITFMAKTGPVARGDGWDLVVHEQRYQNWKRAHDGARKALAGLSEGIRQAS